MRRRCREVPVGPYSAGISVAAGPGEEHYVARLAHKQPIEQTGDLDLYRPSGGLVQVVAVARQSRRIAAWSFALPGESPVWSCYTIHAAGGVAKLPAAGATP